MQKGVAPFHFGLLCWALLTSCAEPERLGLVAEPPFSVTYSTELTVGVTYLYGISLFRYDRGCPPGTCGRSATEYGYDVLDAFWLYEVSCDGCEVEVPDGAEEVASWRAAGFGDVGDSLMPVRVTPTRAGEFTLRFSGTTLDGEPVEGARVSTASAPATLEILHDVALDPGSSADFLVGGSARWCAELRGADDQALEIPWDHPKWSFGGAPAFGIRALEGPCVVFDAYEAGTSTLTVRAAGLEREVPLAVVDSAQLESVEFYVAASDWIESYGDWYTPLPVEVSPFASATPLGTEFLVGSGDVLMAVGRTEAGRAVLVGMNWVAPVGGARLESLVYDDSASGALAFEILVPYDEPRGCLTVGVGPFAEFPYAERDSAAAPDPELCPSFGFEPPP